jgi:ATP-dependent DNA helicase RecQ
LKNIKTGDKLQYDVMKFEDSSASGLKKNDQGNLLLFSRNFVNEKFNPMLEKGYKVTEARVEYIVFWYDKDEAKEFKIVLPRLRFSKQAESLKDLNKKS